MTRGTLFPKGPPLADLTLAGSPFRYLLHIGTDVRQQGAELLPLLSRALGSCCIRIKVRPGYDARRARWRR